MKSIYYRFGILGFVAATIVWLGQSCDGENPSADSTAGQSTQVKHEGLKTLPVRAVSTPKSSEQEIAAIQEELAALNKEAEENGRQLQAAQQELERATERVRRLDELDQAYDRGKMDAREYLKRRAEIVKEALQDSPSSR